MAVHQNRTKEHNNRIYYRIKNMTSSQIHSKNLKKKVKRDIGRHGMGVICFVVCRKKKCVSWFSFRSRNESRRWKGKIDRIIIW